MQTTNYLRTRGHKTFVMFCSIFKQPGLGDKYANMGTLIDWVKHEEVWSSNWYLQVFLIAFSNWNDFEMSYFLGIIKQTQEYIICILNFKMVIGLDGALH